MLHQTPETTYAKEHNRPPLPCFESRDFQRSHIAFNDRERRWTTEHRVEFVPKCADGVTGCQDTKKLQQTHWGHGNAPTTRASEYRAEYTPKGDCRREPLHDPLELQATHWSQDDGVTRMERTRDMAVATERPPQSDFRDRMVGTHWSMKSKEAPAWSTTTRDAYQPRGGDPAKPIDGEFYSGAGLRGTFAGLKVEPVPQTLYRESYQDRGGGEAARPATATVRGSSILFPETTGQRWQATHMQIGDGQGHYERAPPAVAGPVERPATANPKLQESHLRTHWFDPEYSTTQRDAFQAYPGAKPPAILPASAFQSHHQFRNWDQPATTSYRTDYVPKESAVREAFAPDLQASHALPIGGTGEPGQTLYRDTFIPHPPVAERADAQAARDFHMGHHTRGGGFPQTGSPGQTTYEATFVHHRDAKPPELVEARQDHDILGQDPRCGVGRSTMKDDYQPKVAERSVPVDNKLQKSHVQLAFGESPWSTTQSEYFLWQKYRRGPCEERRTHKLNLQ